MDFVLKLVGQFFPADKSALQQAGNKSASPGERVNDVNILAAQALPEFTFQNVIDAVDDEIHHFDRGIDNAQSLRHLGECVSEKLVVKLDDDFTQSEFKEED